jgi:NAD(P)-dependent dehydrogenase (short-subunit alcohol dehydrogenase family)
VLEIEAIARYRDQEFESVFPQRRVSDDQGSFRLDQGIPLWPAIRRSTSPINSVEDIPRPDRGTPKECADLVLVLATDEPSFISGAEIVIDGG